MTESNENYRQTVGLTLDSHSSVSEKLNGIKKSGERHQPILRMDRFLRQKTSLTTTPVSGLPLCVRNIFRHSLKQISEKNPKIIHFSVFHKTYDILREYYMKNEISFCQ